MLAMTRSCFRQQDVAGGRQTYAVLGSNALDKRHDFVACCRVQSRGWFVKEQDLRAGDQLARDAQTALLATAYAFADRGSNKDVGGRVQSKCRNEGLNAIHSLNLPDRTWAVSTGSNSPWEPTLVARAWQRSRGFPGR